MEHDPLKGMELDEDKLDAELAAAFRSAGPPVPSPAFAARTMRAVKRAPLSEGRRALRHPLAFLAGWAAMIAIVAFSMLMVAASQPIVASGFSRLISRGVGAGVWLLQFKGALLALADVLTTTGLAVARAAATREGSTGLALTAVIGAISLSALRRLLISEGGDEQWHEVS
jgi:hypothetical protein